MTVPGGLTAGTKGAVDVKMKKVARKYYLYDA
jgi:hypothetical protein